MNKLEKMWAALLAYLPQATKAGHGDSWAKMCSEKTLDAAAAAAAAAAAYAAYAAAAAAYDAAAYAADAATAVAYAAYAAATAVAADNWAQKAIDRITKITEVI